MPGRIEARASNFTQGMDIHRCRFVPYPSSAINAIAFSHSSAQSKSRKAPPTLRLALGRANGNIEIWNPLNGVWSHEITIHGGKGRTVDALVWIKDPDEEDYEGRMRPGKLRLFSIGYSAAVTEWDLAKRQPARHSSGNHGEIWCLAAQPAWQPKPDQTKERQQEEDRSFKGQNLVAGCADGSIVVLHTAHGDLEFFRTLQRSSAKKARILSITFIDRNNVAAGCADGHIRIYDTRNGNQIRSIGLGKGPTGGPKQILVWSVKCLPDGTIVSGDSTGEVRFWDAKTHTQTQRLQAHKADLLTMDISADGTTIFTGGMDRRTVVFQKTGSNKDPRGRRWAELYHRRYHDHDVKAMASFDSKHLSVLVSGGLDTNPIVMPVRAFATEHHRTLQYLPQEPPMDSAPATGLFVSWWGQEVRIWRMLKTAEFRSIEDDDDARNHKLVSRLGVKGEESITHAAISEKGDLLAVSTLAETRLFRLRPGKEGPMDSLRIKKLLLPPRVSKMGGTHLRISPDGKWLLNVTCENSILLVRIVGHESPDHPLRALPKHLLLKRLPRKDLQDDYRGTLGGYGRTIIRTAFSADSRILVVADLAGYLDSWVLEGKEDLIEAGHIPNGHADVSVSGSGSDSDSSSSSSGHHSVDSDVARPQRKNPGILGQSWHQSPNANLLPRLPSSPLILSFRPYPRKHLSNGLPNGNIAPSTHPTRSNTQRNSHSLAKGDDRLLVLSTTHEVYEFNVLSGSLTDWARRNPASVRPENFSKLRDRVMGVLWDVDEQLGRERVWLYGVAWMGCFDLGRDFLPPSDDYYRQLKRRRTLEEGAGSAVNPQDEDLRRPAKVRRLGENGKRESAVQIGESEESDESEDVEGEGYGPSSTLLRIRKGEGNQGSLEAKRPIKAWEAGNWWVTTKYRPILGVVPIKAFDMGETSESNEKKPGIEVALIERPAWDLDLPPRFDGDQEWGEQGLVGVLK
ncbi:MAG: U3 small nucleolar RNA-associated protein [Vezdaea acicularis]|nr:MAG: U3 small nucleolar RNA-associated protein [Vezdaea acicularis]